MSGDTEESGPVTSVLEQTVGDGLSNLFLCSAVFFSMPTTTPTTSHVAIFFLFARYVVLPQISLNESLEVFYWPMPHVNEVTRRNRACTGASGWRGAGSRGSKDSLCPAPSRALPPESRYNLPRLNSS